MIEITHTNYEVFMRDTKDGTYSKQKIFHSEYVIEKIVFYKLLDRIAILYSYEFYKEDSQNVICIDTKGTLQWKIPPIEEEMKGNIMVNIDVKKKKYLQVWSFDGIYRLIDVASGKVINQLWGK